MRRFGAHLCTPNFPTYLGLYRPFAGRYIYIYTNRLPKQTLQYKPKGRRNIGGPRKRWRDQLHLEDQGTRNTPKPSGTWWRWKVVNLDHVVGMVMRIHKNCSGKYRSNTKICKGLVVINTKWQAKVTYTYKSKNNDHQNKTVFVSIF